MRQQEEQIHDERPEAVRSDPVPVPPGTAGTGPGRTLTDPDDPDRVLADRDEQDKTLTDRDAPDGSLSDPDRDLDGDLDRDLDGTTTMSRDTEHESIDQTVTDRDGRTGDDVEPGDRVDGHEFQEPPNQPTAFGAATVGGAAAASALASPVPADERDARDEDTVRPGDGAVAEGTVPGEVVDRTDEQGEPSGTEAVDEPGVSPGETLPGGVPAEPVTALIPADAARDFRDRWREVQLRFVDDPQAAAAQARELAGEAIDAMTTALARQRDELGSWQRGESGDTEQLRIAVRRYRDLLDRMLGD